MSSDLVARALELLAETLAIEDEQAGHILALVALARHLETGRHYRCRLSRSQGADVKKLEKRHDTG